MINEENNIVKMIIKEIFEKDYPNNKKIMFECKSDYYYDITSIKKDNDEGWQFDWNLHKFEVTFAKSLEELLFEPYKENVQFFQYLDNHRNEIGIVAFGKQEWNNVVRIWDVYIDKQYQRNGIGTELINFVEKHAINMKCRALVLECQSSNYPAIQFYLKNGFSLTGFDLISYSNDDIKNKEIRFEMSKLLKFEK